MTPAKPNRKASETIKAERGIEIPETKGRPVKYPWATMKVGESFRLATKYPQQASRASVRYAPRKFAARNMGDHFRVWRIK